MIDIGTNFHSGQLKGKTAQLIQRARRAGVYAVLASGTSAASSELALQLARDYAGYIHATAGVHPHDAKHWSQAKYTVTALWACPEVVAVGECGLDYNRMFSPKDTQKQAFADQLAGALEFGKPLFLHNRDAFADFRAMTREAAQAGARGVVHCFTGTADEVLQHLADGFEIGITGWVADPRRGQALREALPHIPLDKLHLETDAPYLMPRNKPQSGSMNEPANLHWVALAVAEVLGKEVAEIAAQCTVNSARLFGITPQK